MNKATTYFTLDVLMSRSSQPLTATIVIKNLQPTALSTLRAAFLSLLE